MVGHLGLHGADDGDVIGMRRGFGKQFADFEATLAVAREAERRGQGTTSLPLGGERGWQGLAGIVGECRLRVERVDVRGTPIEKEVNHSLGARRKVKACSGRRTHVVSEQGAQTERSESHPGAGQ